ncbi:unnamed protein product [Owenia fusiformis]|uniref:Uncharacterized protein n=1 Tax=Owenia fusiformis TaxID=6347 RepID=A0A8S4Q9H8_OWEFU|nr:unnamed protein product [Owenia fusiformis]
MILQKQADEVSEGEFDIDMAFEIIELVMQILEDMDSEEAKANEAAQIEAAEKEFEKLPVEEQNKLIAEKAQQDKENAEWEKRKDITSVVVRSITTVLDLVEIAVPEDVRQKIAEPFEFTKFLLNFILIEDGEKYEAVAAYKKQADEVSEGEFDIDMAFELIELVMQILEDMDSEEAKANEAAQIEAAEKEFEKLPVEEQNKLIAEKAQHDKENAEWRKRKDITSVVVNSISTVLDIVEISVPEDVRQKIAEPFEFTKFLLNFILIEEEEAAALISAFKSRK